MHLKRKKPVRDFITLFFFSCLAKQIWPPMLCFIYIIVGFKLCQWSLWHSRQDGIRTHTEPVLSRTPLPLGYLPINSRSHPSITSPYRKLLCEYLELFKDNGKKHRWLVGLEPTTLGTTSRSSARLNYSHNSGGGIRTHTGRILSPRPLPLGYAAT